MLIKNLNLYLNLYQVFNSCYDLISLKDVMEF